VLGTSTENILRGSNMVGPHTLIKRPHNLDEIVGRPTGQGFGAARKGPSVTGKPQDVVVEEDYQQGKSFKIED
tara:strand:- start:946 stop:1164 length:219 start_codon:yes stop_codon:yes gene_type:complete